MVNTYIGVVSVIATCIISLHAMELEKELLLKKSPSINGYKTLTEDTFYIIQEQQQIQYKLAQHASLHYHHPCSLLSLSEIYQCFCDTPDNHKRTLFKTMSTKLLLLTCIATRLPKDVIQNHICLRIMDGEISNDLEQKEKDTLKQEIAAAAEKFYTTPIVQAFDVYHAIKIWLADDTKPIGPLYALDEAEQNALLGIQSTWYYSTPVISAESEKLLKHLSPELRQLYLQGKKPVVLDKESSKKTCIGMVIGSTVCCLISGSVVGAIAGCGLLDVQPMYILTLSGPIFGLSAERVYHAYFSNGNNDCCCRKNTFLDM